MADYLAIVLQALWLMLPAYLANMSATLVGGGRPIDGGRNWSDGRRILGAGKTWRGLLVPPVLVAVAAIGLHYLAETPVVRSWGWSNFSDNLFVVAFMAFFLALGALTGDAVESFFKRRLNKPRGAPWFPFDQLDFVVGSLTFALLAASLLQLLRVTPGNWFLETFQWPYLLVILILTPALHFLVNVVGYWLGFKEVWW